MVKVFNLVNGIIVAKLMISDESAKENSKKVAEPLRFRHLFLYEPLQSLPLYREGGFACLLHNLELRSSSFPLDKARTSSCFILT